MTVSGLVRRGWWCELTAWTAAVDGREAKVRAGRADTPEGALVWIRASVRTLAYGLGVAEGARVHAWLEYGQWEAVMRLKSGEAYDFGARLGGTALSWSARPVVFVSLLADCTPAGLEAAEPRGW
ncbi:hypothetical protein JGS22_010380 [Streptomyces sp. P38-E01]|uniref:Uncharacterized protein n=1 Tax=Streptomyces tardus TaxID=2780544 RepID=A0A949JG70_9ACTN|nr:hypothetical protein [Streptomyces tardus]MBU7598005.1 hypothetical protein [Streptomyces tardus]